MPVEPGVVAMARLGRASAVALMIAALMVGLSALSPAHAAGRESDTGGLLTSGVSDRFSTPWPAGSVPASGQAHAGAGTDTDGWGWGTNEFGDLLAAGTIGLGAQVPGMSPVVSDTQPPPLLGGDRSAPTLARAAPGETCSPVKYDHDVHHHESSKYATEVELFYETEITFCRANGEITSWYEPIKVQCYPYRPLAWIWGYHCEGGGPTKIQWFWVPFQGNEYGAVTFVFEAQVRTEGGPGIQDRFRPTSWQITVKADGSATATSLTR